MEPRALLRMRSPAWPAIALLLAACAGPDGPVVVHDRGAPAAARAPAAAAGDYVVRRGDTVYGIAKRNGISTRALIDLNALQPPYLLIPGRTLQLPRNLDYAVRRGDSVYAISRRFGVDMTSLVRLNNIRPPYTIHVGQRLRLPAGARPAEQTAHAAPRTRPPRPGTPRAAASDAAAAPAGKPRPPVRAATAPPPARAGGGFVWPVEGRVLSSFGSKAGGLHNDGVNIAAPRGAPVRAAENGVVAYAGEEIRGFGNLLLIKHDGGLITAYAHADTLLVARGDVVTRGQVIAKVGKTGSVESPQLHFEVRRGARAVNPREYLPG